MLKFRVTQERKVWWSPSPQQAAVCQPVGAVIEILPAQLAQLQQFGHLEDSTVRVDAVQRGDQNVDISNLAKFAAQAKPETMSAKK